MECPNCKHTLKKISRKDIELDQCISCGGIWFQGNTFQNLKDREDTMLRWLDADLFSDPKQFVSIYSSMTCPLDKELLYEISYANSPIKIDVCTKCKGIWLDKNEFESIIAYLKRRAFAATAGDYIAYLKEELKEVLTGPEGFASEFFDAYVVFRLLEYRIVSQWPHIEELLVVVRSAFPK